MHESNKRILREVTHTPGDGAADWLFWCPGCHCAHGVWTSGKNGVTGAVWTFNGNREKPTFTPSLLIQGTEFTERGRADYEAWRTAGCPDRKGQSFESMPTRCHTVITAGVIQYLADCTHALAGKAIPMEPF